MADLLNAKVGDKILVYGTHSKYIATVTHTTKTQVHCNGAKFRRDGHEITTDKWGRRYASIATENEIAQVAEATRRTNLILRIQRFCELRHELEKLSTEKLLDIARTLPVPSKDTQ
jgi:carbon monoxide dehydrogenase subunit G